VDLGPEGGEGGGQIVAQGTPEAVAQVAESYTGRFLQRVLSIAPRLDHEPQPVGAALGWTGGETAR